MKLDPPLSDATSASSLPSGWGAPPWSPRTARTRTVKSRGKYAGTPGECSILTATWPLAPPSTSTASGLTSITVVVADSSSGMSSMTPCRVPPPYAP